MIHMPRLIHGPHGTGIYVPTIANRDWDATLEAIAGRPLTSDERDRADRMAERNWSLRVVATELFGEARTDAHFAPQS